MDTATNQPAYQPPTVQLMPAHQTLCLKTLKFLSDLGPEIEKVEAAGIDVTAWRALRTRLIDINQSIAKDFCGQVHPV